LVNKIFLWPRYSCSGRMNIYIQRVQYTLVANTWLELSILLNKTWILHVYLFIYTFIHTNLTWILHILKLFIHTYRGKRMLLKTQKRELNGQSTYIDELGPRYVVHPTYESYLHHKFTFILLIFCFCSSSPITTTNNSSTLLKKQKLMRKI